MQVMNKPMTTDCLW